MLKKVSAVAAKLKKHGLKGRGDKAQRIVALDIGTEFVKVLIATIHGDQLNIIGSSRVRQNLADMQAGAIADISAVVANCDAALNQAEQSSGATSRTCVIGIAGELVQGNTTTIKISRKDPNRPLDITEIDRMIQLIQERASERAKAKIQEETGGKTPEVKLVNSALVSMEIDGYKVTNPVGFQGKDITVQLYTAFAPQIHIGALEKCANELDMDLLAVAAEPFGVARSVIGNDANSTMSAILIDVGGGTTDIAVVNEGGVEGTKMFSIGGRIFTKAIERDLNVDFVTAEALKVGLSTNRTPEAQRAPVEAALNKTLEVWLNGVELALGEFEKLDHLPHQILLCGGGASLEILVEALKERDWFKELPFTKRPTVQYIMPDQVVGIVDTTDREPDHTFITAMGLLRVAADTLGVFDNPGVSVRDRLNRMLKNMNNSKETIYIDIDEDITGIIDRVVSSKESIVAAVLPKRAGMLHSSVNMRLLKRASEEAKKNLVLITTEAPILKLAGLTRMRVAKSLTSKPYLPEEPEGEVLETIISEPMVEPKVDPEKGIGELAGDKVLPVTPESDKTLDEDTIELDNIDPEKESEDKTKQLPKKDRKLAVPSFDRFRKRIFIFGGLGLFLIIFLFFATFVWPRATITIETEKSNVETRLEFTANIAQVALDEANKVLPAEQKEVKKTLTEKFTATGKQDNGNKATGTMTLKNCTTSENEVVIASGTGFSSSGFTFVSTTAVTLPASSFSGGGTCLTSTRDVNVTAVSGGDDYNLNSRSYTSSIANIVANGSAMSGGTSKIVTVVSQEDIEAAKKIIVAKSTDEYKSELSALFKASSKFGLVETFTAVQGEVTSTPKVGVEAGESTLSIPFTYQMLGVNLNDIEKLLTTVQNDKIDTKKQKIYDSGIDTAKIGQLSRPSAGEAKMSLSGTGIAGPKLDADTIAKEVAGKSGGATKQIISARPDIASVEVRYDPFWVFNTPKKVSRITIIFDATD